MELLLAEACLLAEDALVYVEYAETTQSDDEARETLQKALSLGEQLQTRLEEALDLIVLESDQIRIEDALIRIEDALDEGMLAVISGNVGSHMHSMKYHLSECLTSISPTNEAETDQL
jgi:hypothetical protein